MSGSDNKGAGAKAVLLAHTRLARDNSIFPAWTSLHTQHGIAVPLSSELLAVSHPNQAYVQQKPDASSLATGLQIINAFRRWEQAASFDEVCPEMHGHAALSDRHIFGCKERTDQETQSGGLLLLHKDGNGQWVTRKLGYPDDRRVSTLVSAAKGRLVVGNYGRNRSFNALIRIDPDAGELAADNVFEVPGNQSACQYQVLDDGRRVINLLADGTLRLYDMQPAWKELKSIAAVPAFDCAFGAATPRPALGADGESIFVSDPNNSRIREFSADGLTLRRDLKVTGRPERLAVGRFAN